MYIFFGVFGNPRHCSYRLNGVFARGGLAREHNRACTVINRISNVGYFRARRAHIVYHRFQHFSSRNNAFAEHAAFGNNLFLYRGQLLKGDFNPHIAARHHYSVALAAYFFNIINARAVFNFRNKVDTRGAQFRKVIFNVQKILPAGNKRTGDKVNVVLYSELNILLILIA